MAVEIRRAWWKEVSVYQIYPASFKDSNNDGIGDIPGIISKLDYLKKLGVDIIWICPIYKSPQVDMGYDISDYKDIHEPYGTVADVEELIKGSHERGMKFLMDLVVNHTSAQHAWFQESRKSKDNPYRAYYIWRDPKILEDGTQVPPNNWGAVWGGSAWQWDETTKQYYLHIFAPQQPDLNWEHPPVREAVHDIMRFWLAKGVDGFRMDVINFISKAPGLPDAPVSRTDQIYQSGAKYFACGPRLHEYLLEIGKILKEYNAFSVGEMPCVHEPREILNAVAFDRGELNMIFHFEVVDMDQGDRGKFSPKRWDLSILRTIVNKWQRFMLDNDGWNALYLENHDQSRSVSRFGSDLPEHRVACAKMFATFLALQSGTVFVYQGQELGMINVPKGRDIKEYKDLETLNEWNEIVERYPNDKEQQALTLSEIQKKSRDNARTPMQWSKEPYAGFSTVPPWQKENESYTDINAEAQFNDPYSVFSYWSAILGLRKTRMDIFIYGDFELVDAKNKEVLAYIRKYKNQGAIVVTNFKSNLVKWSIPQGVKLLGDKLLISNYFGLQIESGFITLRPFEAIACLVS